MRKSRTAGVERHALSLAIPPSLLVGAVLDRHGRLALGSSDHGVGGGSGGGREGRGGESTADEEGGDGEEADHFGGLVFDLGFSEEKEKSRNSIEGKYN